MGRPRELSEQERAALLAKGYKPVEIWVPDWWSSIFDQKLEEIGSSIRQSDRNSRMDQVLEAFIEDVWDDLR